MKEQESEYNVNELLDENNRLRVTIEELSILNEIATAVSSSQSLQEIESLIIKKCLKYLSAEEGVIMLLEKDNFNKPFHTILRTQNSAIASSAFKLDDQILGWVMKNKTSLTVNNFQEDNRFNLSSKKDLSLNSFLAVPMFVKRNLIGIIVLFNKHKGAFTEGDQRLLAICASQSAQVIESARLYSQEQHLTKLKEEMDLAARIQINLLPKESMLLNGFQIIGQSIPAREVGGDFFDFVPFAENLISIWLGDVSGKGIPAALLMANLQGFLRSRSFTDKDCNITVQASNDFMVKNDDNGKFATLFYSILNTETGLLNFIIAGHNNILHIKHSAEIDIYKSSDIPIGIYRDYKFEDRALFIEEGDFLLIYSDGITEAEDKNESLFGEERLIEIVRKHLNDDPKTVIESIFAEVNLFSMGSPQNDDQTLLLVKLDSK